MSDLRVTMVDPSGYSIPYDFCLSNALERTAADVQLYTKHDWEEKYTLPSPGFNLHQHYYRRTANLKLNGWRRLAFKGVEHAVDQLRLTLNASSDVLHFQWAPIPSYDWLIFRLVKRSTPVVLTVHNVLPHEQSRHDRLVRRQLFRSADRLVVHTESSERDLISEFGISADKIDVVPHGNFCYLREHDIDLSKLSPSVRNLRTSPTILAFGLIREYKRLDRAIRALAELQIRVPDATLLVVGNPRVDLEPYRELAAKLDVTDSVEFVTEYVPDELVPSYFDVADVALFPYENIDQSGAALLAASLGVPIVATDVGGFRDVIDDGENGFLVDESPSAIADAVACILTDDRRAEQMGEVSYRRATDEFNWENIARQTVGVYRKCDAKI